MNLPNWTLEAPPQAKRLLHAVAGEDGVARKVASWRRSRQSALPSWTWFGAGLLVGAGMAWWLTHGTPRAMGGSRRAPEAGEAPRGEARGAEAGTMGAGPSGEPMARAGGPDGPPAHTGRGAA